MQFALKDLVRPVEGLYRHLEFGVAGDPRAAAS